MSETDSQKPGGDAQAARLKELLDAWLKARDQGETVSPEDLCRANPELLDPLVQKIAERERLTVQMEGDDAQEEIETLAADTLSLQSNLTQLGFHAKGGLGAVYQATDANLHRRVAVKFIHTTLVANPDSRQDFAIEAEVTGRLEHPGIVPLYGAGEAADGRPFYVMRFIDGHTFAAAIDLYHKRRKGELREADDNLAFKELLRQFISVCQTIAYAHNRGIVHHDIKPENVMLGKYGETIVVDWGLARPVKRDERFRLSGERTLQVQAVSDLSATSGSRRGTPAYMSPEQISGLPSTPASDIYSLGIMLYKLLTGRTPFAASHGAALLEHVVTGRIEPPSTIRPSVPRALEAICLKAVATQPISRYATALDLARDVERFLADERVEVYREPRSVKLFRWARRHRAPVMVGVAALLTVAVVTLASSLWTASLARSERKARHQAEMFGEMSEAARRENLQSSVRFLAERIGHEIDLRWRVLELEAASPRLRELIKAVNADPAAPEPRQPLQAWLNERKLDRGDSIVSAAWIIYSTTGIQAARAPKERSIGKSFAHRDYFHGFGKDFDKNDPRLADLRPLQFVQERARTDEIVHMSAVFESTNSHTLVVTFAVPIWSGPEEDAERKIIGVMSMPLAIRDFDLPRNALLFQITPNQYDDVQGHVIGHIDLGPTSKDDLPPRVSDKVLAKAENLRRILGASRARLTDQDTFLEAFTDPITKTTSPAAMSPVFVASRPATFRDTGWAVIVKETVDAPPEPASQ
jgi:serine/threonine-protein kinase